MQRSIARRLVPYCSALLLLMAFELWGSSPLADPDPAENGDNEVQLAPQGELAPPAGARGLAPRRAVFAGNAYLVGSPVTATKTLPEAETNIVTNPANQATLVGIITDYSLRSGNDSTNGVSKYAISNDHGMTWGQAFVPVSNKYPITSDGIQWLVDRDPGVAIDLAGNIYFSGLYLKLAPAHSSAGHPSIARATTPGGVYVCAGTLPVPRLTSASCRPIVTDTSLQPTTSVDRDWMAVDASNSPYSGNVYVSWTYYTGCANGTCATKYIALSRSTDHGVTWSTPVQVNTSAQTIVDWSMVTVGSDGTVYVAYEVYFTTNAQRMHYVATSTDGGVTFGAPIAMTPLFSNVEFPCAYRKNSAPNIVVSSVSGAEYVYDVYAGQGSGGASTSNIYVVRSTLPRGAGGFTSPVIINDSTTGEREYAAAALDAGGTLHTLWLDTRNSPQDDSQYDVYATYSQDGGVTFAPNARVTPSLINGNTSFIGDFFGITAEPTAGVAHAVWSNGGLLGGQMQTATLTPQ